MAAEEKSGGIRTVAVGFGGMTDPRPSPLQPAPPYRLLIAGDFGLGDSGNTLYLGKGTAADILREAAPEIEVTVPNLLGSFPVEVQATLRLTALRDIQPRNLLRQFDHHRQAVEGLSQADSPILDRQPQRYEYLAARAAKAARNGVAKSGGNSGGDGLDGLFDLIAAPQTPEAANHRTGSQVPLSGDGTEALLNGQAMELFAHPRLRQVLENWHALHFLRDREGASAGTEITLLQFGVEEGADAIREYFESEEDGIALDTNFDLVLFANRCGATAEGAAKLKALAEFGQEFDVVSLCSLDPDFAGTTPETLSAMDAPHQLLDRNGFENFNGLRARSEARWLGVFWNDVLIAEETPVSPEYFMPAAWAATAIVLRNVEDRGWPSLNDVALQGFPVAIRMSKGREAAISTRAMISDTASESLATVGISALAGHRDRDSIHLDHGPTFAAETAKTEGRKTNLTHQLIVARLAELLQSTLPPILGMNGTNENKAEAARNKLTELARSLPHEPVFHVDLLAADDDGSLLEIRCDLPADIAGNGRYEFKIQL